jgi:hypothetical protein|tara:strand:- start:18778 stop:19044 length:267 start_codon:yes stop_codon:yes gene_type:complete
MTLKKKNKKTEKIKIILVVWMDAVAETGWIKLEDAKRECQLSECVTIGYLIDRNKDRLLIACTKSENEYNAMINIPTAWVKETRDIWI